MTTKPQFGSVKTAGHTDQATERQLAVCFFDEGHRKGFSSLQRYIAAADRTYRQALKVVQEAIKRRPEPVAKLEAVPAQAPKPKVAAAGQSFDYATGFEPQNAETRPAAEPTYPALC